MKTFEHYEKCYEIFNQEGKYFFLEAYNICFVKRTELEYRKCLL